MLIPCEHIFSAANLVLHQEKEYLDNFINNYHKRWYSENIEDDSELLKFIEEFNLKDSEQESARGVEDIVMTKARNSLENEEVDLFQNHKIQRQICDLSFKNEGKSVLSSDNISNPQDVSKRMGAPKKVHKLASYFAVGSSKKKENKSSKP